jgi:uncharacterized protein YndB with AHSA1/START domain
MIEEFGTVTEPRTVRLARSLPGPIDRVWAHLTESDKRGTWLASGAMEMRIGGRVQLDFHHAALSAEKTAPAKYRQYEGGVSLHGHITRLEPPHLLAYTWNEKDGVASEVTFELTPQGDRVLLELTHRRLPDQAEMISVAGGWHTHLGILIDNLEGREPRPFWSTHAKLEEEYRQRFAA